MIKCVQVIKPCTPPASALQVIKAHKQAAAEEAALAAMERLAVAAPDSLHGGMHDMPGSEVRGCARLKVA